MKDQTVRRKERTDRRRGRTGPLARLHDVTHTHTETHKSEADPRMIFLLSSSVTPPGNQSSCLCLLHTVCLSVYMYSGVYICMCAFALVCVWLFTSGPGRHVCHLLKCIEEGSGHHDGRPESQKNSKR